MAINSPNNVVQGPADLYWGVVGAVEPLDTAIASAPDSSVWTDFGATTGGTTFDAEETLSQIVADQSLDNLGARVSDRTITVTTTLLEATLENMYQLMNQSGTVTTGTGVKSYEPSNNTSATQPTYTALIVDGWAPMLTTGAPARRRAIVRRCLSTPKITNEYKKDGQTTLAVTFTAYYVSKSIAPYRIIDQTA